MWGGGILLAVEARKFAKSKVCGGGKGGWGGGGDMGSTCEGINLK